MADEKENQAAPEQSNDVLDENWREQFKRVMQAGIGAVALAQEEVEQVVKKLVQKGALVESEGRKWVADFMEKGYQQTKDKVNSFEQNLETNVEAIVKKFSLPSKGQIEELAGKVEELSRKVDELMKKLQ